MDIVLKRKIKKIADEKRLYRIISNSKWCDLLLAMETEMPFQPPFILKRLDEELSPEEPPFEDHMIFFGDWSFESICKGNFFVIDWIKIYPYYYAHQRYMGKPKKVNAAKKLKEILETYAIPYTIKNELFIISGYNR